MILVVDIGNTNIVLGGYSNNHLQFTTRISTDRFLEADQYAVELKGIFELYQISSNSISGVMISSVVPRITPIIIKAFSHFTTHIPHVLNSQDANTFKINIDNPYELGMDILASAIAVNKNYPVPAIIIDMGTATKFTALDKNGNLHGVSIAPGLFVSLDALLGGASLLKGIALEAPALAIGKNTPDSMKSGIILGTASMLDGMIERFQEELGTIATIVATGGAASLVVPYCKHSITLCESLLLDGLFYAYCNRTNFL